MAYDANNHNVFAQRCRNLARELHQLKIESQALNDIYVNETVSGAVPAWTDNDNGPIASNAEMTELMNLGQRLRDMLAMDGESQVIAVEDQTARLTPFLQ